MIRIVSGGTRCLKELDEDRQDSHKKLLENKPPCFPLCQSTIYLNTRSQRPVQRYQKGYLVSFDAPE